MSSTDQANTNSTTEFCTLDTCPISDSVFGYRPSLGANVTFLVLFALSACIHVYQGIRTKKRAFWISVLLGCFCEVIGYIGRILMSNNPFDGNGFLIQICCLTIGPAFFAAAIYFTFGDIVRGVSLRASRLKPTHYWRIFIPCDVISLTLQGTGGGMASVASDNNDRPATQRATNIMIAGLAFQVASMAAFILLSLDYAWRVRKLEKGLPHLHTSRTRLALFVGFFSTAILAIFIRCIYRVFELSEGWDGPLIGNQAAFIVLEGL